LALAGVLFLAVFPTKAWLDQRRTRQALAAQLAALNEGNRQLQGRVDQLGTDDEIERLARQYNLVKPGEEAYFILPQPPGPAAETASAPPPPPHRSKSLWERFTSLF
jgi:cell division protein FtsB